MKAFLIICIGIFLHSCSAPKTGHDVLKLMKSKYDGVWYKTLTFKQETTWYKPDGEIAREQLWYEALKMPNQLTIKFDSITSGNGILFKNDNMYQMQNGEVAGSVKRYHDLLILGFDVYFDPIETTANKLITSEFDLNFLVEKEIDGKPMYVIGQNPEVDSVMNHFVIDKEHLLFQYTKKKNYQTGNVSKTIFTDYVKMDGGWVGKRVDFYVNDKLFLKEIYRDVEVNVELNDDIFNPDLFQQAMW